MNMKFGVAVSIVETGYVEVEADSESEAKALAGGGGTGRQSSVSRC